jgi:epoxyqueuosine reductase
MRLSPEAWDEFTRGSPVRRARREGLLRNVAVALGNWGSDEALPPLVEALSDSESLVRGHAAWALGEIGSPLASAALVDRLTSRKIPGSGRNWNSPLPASGRGPAPSAGQCGA